MTPLGRLRPRRLGLRARVAITFALGSVALSALLAGATYVATRSTLLRQREDALLSQAFFNARYTRDSLRSADPKVADIISSLQRPTGSYPVVWFGNAWYPLNVRFGPEVLPAALQDRVSTGVAARMRYRQAGVPYLAVGVPVTAEGAEYYEILPLAELEDNLRTIGLTLVGAAALTTVLGTFVGVWAGRRATRPLAEAARAAKGIAAGALDTRMPRPPDRDLAVLAESFNEMAQALQDRVERDARFASDVSHELRSPLMTLAASIEVLRSRRDELTERGVAALDLLSAEVRRFSHLVEDLLEISRFDAGAVRLDVEEVLVAELVPNAVAATTGGDVPVTIEPGAEGLVVRADKRRMGQVLSNLLDNARIHAGGAIAVVVEPAGGANGTRPGPDAVRIAVDDAGPGVAVDERSLVFERFARGSSAGRRGAGDGAGLGLALVDEHVRLLGGRVWVADRPGGPGARFVIELPVARP